VVGMHGPIPHWFGEPPVPVPPPHTSGAVHVPQSSIPPHPSASVPHVAPRAWQVVGVHPHTLGVPPPAHVLKPVQVPQVCVFAQLSTNVPQLAPIVSQVAVGEHPQTPDMPPPPHVCGRVHEAPQLTVPPHPSSMDPQLSPAGQVACVHPHTFAAPPPPQVSEPMHVAHVMPPAPQASWTFPGWQLSFESQQPLQAPGVVPHDVPHTPVARLHASPRGQLAADVQGVEVSAGGGAVSREGGAESKGGIVVSMVVSALPVSVGDCWTTSDVASRSVAKSEQDGHSPLWGSPQPSDDAISAKQANRHEARRARTCTTASWSCGCAAPLRPTALADELTTPPGT
jgi:hypothetical protein